VSVAGRQAGGPRYKFPPLPIGPGRAPWPLSEEGEWGIVRHRDDRIVAVQNSDDGFPLRGMLRDRRIRRKRGEQRPCSPVVAQNLLLTAYSLLPTACCFLHLAVLAFDGAILWAAAWLLFLAALLAGLALRPTAGPGLLTRLTGLTGLAVDGRADLLQRV
jgi:hypothetical protein